MTNHEPKEPPFDAKQLVDFDPATIIGQILPRGHSFHGFSTASNERVIQILSTRDYYADDAELLGYGVDSDAEMAMGRAIATYIQREMDGLAVMAADQYPHLTEGFQGSIGHGSKFDNIVWGGDFTLFQDGEFVVATSSFGGGWGLEPLEVRAATAYDAMYQLAEQYRPATSFASVRDKINALPKLQWAGVEVDLEQPAVE